jgi:hypothetical protein
MVCALLEGRKWQTRRILKPQPVAYQNEYCTRLRFFNRDGSLRGDASPDGPKPVGAALFAPYAEGDRLWVRETWEVADNGHEEWPIYRATGDELQQRPPTRELSRWRPSIFMPRWASRLTLDVTDVRVQRVQDISDDDALAEGCVPTSNGAMWLPFKGSPHPAAHSPVGAFHQLWMLVNGNASWSANPWVVAVSFHVRQANIDTVLAAAEAA